MHSKTFALALFAPAAVGVAIASSAATADAQSAPAAAASAATAPAPAASSPARRPVMGLMVPLTKPPSANTAAVQDRPFAYQNTKPTAKAEKYYAHVWGVDRLRANYTSSGNLIRFSYRVLNAKLAATLGIT